MKKFVAVVLIAVFTILMVPASTALATEPNLLGTCGDGVWSLYFNFTSGDGDFVDYGLGTYVAGVGWSADQLPGWREEIYAFWSPSGFEDATYTSVTYYHTNSGSGSYWIDSAWRAWASGSGPVTYEPVSPLPIWIPIITQTTEAYYLTVYGVSVEGLFTGVCPVEEWVPYDDSTYKPIHEAILFEVNHVTGYGPIVDDVHTELAASVYNSFAGQVVSISSAGSGYMVKVVADDDTYAIYDNLSSVNPSLNDQIVAGCVLGTVGESFKAPSQTYTQNPGLLWYYPGTDFYDFETNEYIDWQTEYVEPPATAIPCGSDLITPHCLNYNPSLDNRAAGWTAVNVDEYDIGDTRVKLSEYQSTLSQMIILDHEANYYVDLKTEQYGSLYDYISFVLMKATDYTILDTETITLEPDNLGDELITQIGPLDFNSDFDVNDAYLIAVMASNPDTSGVWIDDVCVNLGDAQTGIQNCYFDNFQLDGDTGWDSSETADWSSNPDTFGTGVVLGPGDWISQPLALLAYSDAAADYTLTVTAKTTAIDLGDIIDIFTTGWVADLSQEVKTGETVELDIGDVTVNNVLISLQYITDFTVDYETTLSGDLTLTSDPLNEKDIYIDWVCLDAKTGVWPGDENNDIETGELTSCDACSMPTSTVALFEWLMWLWCNISRFFNCTLVLWLNYLQSLIRQLGDLIGLIGRYIGVIVGQVATWLLALIVAFGIALRDMLIYGASLIWNFLADLGFIRLLYDLIGYAIATVTGIIHIGDLMLTTIGLLFGALLTLGRLAGVFAASLSAGLAGDVATITIPSCATPSSPVWEGFCVVFQMADGLFAEFPALGVGMIIDAGLIGLITSVWTVRSIGGALGDI